MTTDTLSLKLVAYTDKEETASNKKTLKEQKQSEAFQKKYDNWTKKLEKKWDYDKDVDQKLWAQVSLKSGIPQPQRHQQRQQQLPVKLLQQKPLVKLQQQLNLNRNLPQAKRGFGRESKPYICDFSRGGLNARFKRSSKPLL